jgi:hypothetical protein
MRKIEIVDEEILIVKQALSLYKEKLQKEKSKINIFEVEVVEKILEKIKKELNK